MSSAETSTRSLHRKKAIIHTKNGPEWVSSHSMEMRLCKTK